MAMIFKTSEHPVVKMAADLSDFQELLPLVSAFGRENSAVRRFSAFFWVLCSSEKESKLQGR